jgi:hypothetical protein
VSLSIIIVDLPILLGPFFLHWGSCLGIGPLDFLVLCFAKPPRIVLRARRWGNISFWYLLFGVDSVSIEKYNMLFEDTYVSIWIIEAHSSLSFIDRGFALGNCYYDCFYGIEYTCTDVVSSRNMEVECLWSVGVKSLSAHISNNSYNKELSGGWPGYIGYSGLLFGINMDPS